MLQKKKNLRLLQVLRVSAHRAAVGRAQRGRGFLPVAGA